MSELEKEKKNIAFAFDKIADSYDRANRFISLGMDLLWRNRMMKYLAEDKPLQLVDIACGTCDSAIAAIRKRPNIEKLVGLDASEGMLARGNVKIKQANINCVELVKGDMLDLPFGDGDFDCATIVFGLRNAPDTAKAISEAARVVKSGGKCLFLEFSMPENILFKSFYFIYLKYCMPLIAFIVSGRYKAYKYLFRSVNEFYRPREVLEMMEKASLKSKVESMAGGAVWLYIGEKV